MTDKTAQADIETVFHDPAELAAQAAAARAAAKSTKDEDKTEDLRPLKVMKAAGG